MMNVTPPPPLATTVTTTTAAAAAANVLSKDEAECAIQHFCQLIQFPTVSALAIESGAYQQCGQWILQQLQSISGLFDETNNNGTVFVLPESSLNAPVIIACWYGIDRTLPVLVLNSHYDVVPAILDDWTIPPFDGIRQNGNIYGRGTQDMKSVCIQYIEAIRKIHVTNPDWKPLRDIYLTFVPDEEVGGSGMATFLSSQLYQQTIPGIALALDEGLASTNDCYNVFYGERLPWWIDVTASGPTGHGSRFIESTAVGQIIGFANKALEYRDQQRQLIGLSHNHNCSHAIAAAAASSASSIAAANTTATVDDTTTTLTKTDEKSIPTNTLGDVTSLNITMLEAGVRVNNTYAYNCVPPKARCALDIRISPHTSPSDISAMLDRWCIECSSSSSSSSTNENNKNVDRTLQWSYIGGHGNDMQQHAVTSVDPNINPWYRVLVNSIEGCCGDSDNNTDTTNTNNSTNGLNNNSITTTSATRMTSGCVVPQVFPAATDSRFLRALGVRAFGFSPIRKTEIMLHENDEYIPESIFIEGIGVYYHLIQALGSFVEE
jgi:aminoacylase